MQREVTMQRACEKFLSLMSVELKDLEEHIDDLICQTLDRYEREEISEHVCLSNLAVFRQEKHAFGHFEGSLSRMRSNEYADIPELVMALKSMLREETVRFDLSEAACHFAEHKMRRIEDYISNTHWSEEKQAYFKSIDLN
jgi:hypothetical protein